MTTAVRSRLALEGTDADLTAAAAAGDDRAFDELYHRHADAAWGVAMATLRNPEDARDAVAEAFARVFKSLGATRSFRPYLLTTVRNCAIDIVRRADRLELSGALGDGVELARPEQPVDPVVAGEDERIVVEAFGQLPRRWQQALWLIDVEQLSTRDAGSAMGVSANNAAQLATRARSRLREAYLQLHVPNHVRPGCGVTVAVLGAFVAGTAPARTRRNVEAHLAACTDCQGRVAELQDVACVLRRAFLPVPVGLLGARVGDGGRFLRGWLDRLYALFAPRPTGRGVAGLLPELSAASPIFERLVAGTTVAVIAVGISTLAVTGHDSGTGATDAARPPAPAAAAGLPPGANGVVAGVAPSGLPAITQPGAGVGAAVGPVVGAAAGSGPVAPGPARISGRDLTGADLSGAPLAGADLSGADLSGANLAGANLEGADLSGTNLTGALLGGVNLAGANLAGANLTGALLGGAQLPGASLVGANLSGVEHGTVIPVGPLLGIRAPEDPGVNLRGADLTGALLQGSRLPGADLTGAKLGTADLTGAVLKGVKLAGADVTAARLVNTDLRNADLGGVDLGKADARGALLSTPSSIVPAPVVPLFGPALRPAGGSPPPASVLRALPALPANAARPAAGVLGIPAGSGPAPAIAPAPVAAALGSVLPGPEAPAPTAAPGLTPALGSVLPGPGAPAPTVAPGLAPAPQPPSPPPSLPPAVAAGPPVTVPLLQPRPGAPAVSGAPLAGGVTSSLFGFG